MHSVVCSNFKLHHVVLPAVKAGHNILAQKLNMLTLSRRVSHY